MTLVSTAAQDRARKIVESLGGRWNGTRGECLCPAHDDHTPSLSVRLGKSAILFKCFAGCSQSEVLKALDRNGFENRSPISMPTSRPNNDFSDLARELWKKSDSVAGTPAESYLHARDLFVATPQLRYNANTIIGKGRDRRILPAMIAAVRNEIGIVAVHRTFLDPSDILRRPFRKPKLALGFLGSGAVRFGEPDEELGLAEGIEDALSAIEWFGGPVWAVLGAERYTHIAIPSQVRRITVFGQRNRAARTCYMKAVDHLAGNDRHVSECLPSEHDDWNDAWRARQTSIAMPSY
ncbi:toprim domain-containing protein [Sphingomonas sp. 10B4]|uniref:DUF7146 domain-containing protein n=1 Tax=Sphingomonas sp. 10B4 TaxID=3048575 RepID=UPI002AB525CB|nr:toprim domain-containing protein [Sphingomonas sp. 10B4]MDY7524260.1 toprim domain-containing protein [Sphingomonas sp. 10B4]MEB0283798.1 toprim domain-containing protein [Sphingomonas sp. 10B4]